MFDFLKKKKEEPTYDVTNLSLKDLDVGFIFEYDMKSWVVKEAYEYDWGNNNFSKEYKVDAGDEVAFLGIEDDGELNISLTKAIKMREIDEDVADEIVKNDKPQRKIHFGGELYHLDSDSAGYFKDLGKDTDDWDELVSWEFYNEDEDKIVSITRWDEQTFEYFAGVVPKEYQFSNIIPGQ